MAYDFVPASSQCIQIASAPVTSAPLTMACWVYPDQTGALNYYIYMGDSGSNRFGLATISNTFIAGCSPGGDSTIAITSGGWRHCAGVFTSSTSRTVYLNGVAGTTNTTSGAPAGVDRMRIGAGVSSNTNFAFHDGRICEVGVWNAALNADEILSLAKGISPSHVRPQSLVFYAPLIRGLIDEKGGLTLTASGSPAVIEHPRIYR